MGYYRVQQGDCLSSIASEHGFADCQTIYQRPENVGFRQKRPNPNVICPEDDFFIPDPEIKTVSIATGQRHVFQLKLERVQLRLCLKDDLHRPYESTKYHLRIGHAEWDGSTDRLGMVEQEIEAGATQGEITVFPSGNNKPGEGYTFSLKLGHLDPVEEVSGIDARLLNLGFGPFCAEERLPNDDRARALKAFQNKFGLDATGELSDKTRSKLREVHDGD